MPKIVYVLSMLVGFSIDQIQRAYEAEEAIKAEDAAIVARHAEVYEGKVNCQTDYECEVLSPISPDRFVGPQMFCDDPWFHETDEPQRAECEE